MSTPPEPRLYGGMASQQPRKDDVTLVAEFIDTKAPEFHSAFGSPSELNRSAMEYERLEVRDLRETLECHCQKAPKYIDFTHDLNTCTWKTVLEELGKAQAAAAKSEKGGKNPIKKTWRLVGSTSSILAPGLTALPDWLCVLNGGLALVFALARHSEMNRLKILGAFEKVPNIIEMARNKVETFPLDKNNFKTVKLHASVEELQATLLQTLPVLINKLVPGTFLNVWRSPFGAFKIDRLLDGVAACAEAVRICAEDLIEELIMGNYSASINIQSQLDEVLRQQRMMQMSIDAAHGKTHLLHFLMEQINFHPTGVLASRDPADMSDMGTALPGYMPEDLLKIIDVNHLRISNDAAIVIRKGPTLASSDIERAALTITAPQVKELLSSDGPSVVAVDGHFDRTQMGKIGPMSYICAMLSQALRSSSPQSPGSVSPGSPLPPQGERGQRRSVVLEYYCALHTTDDDDLRGPQGLMRGITTQLILALVANEWIGQNEAVHLPHLRDGEEELLGQQNLDAVCRLFAALLRIVPRGVPIYCLVDGWSSYEREDLWRVDYDAVLKGFGEAADASNPDGSVNFKLLLTSSTASRWLDDFLMPGQKVSLRSRGATGSNGRSMDRGGLMGLARAATMSDAHSGFMSSFRTDEDSQPWTRDGYSSRASM